MPSDKLRKVISGSLTPDDKRQAIEEQNPQAEFIAGMDSAIIGWTEPDYRAVYDYDLLDKAGRAMEVGDRPNSPIVIRRF